MINLDKQKEKLKQIREEIWKQDRLLAKLRSDYRKARSSYLRAAKDKV